MGAPVVKARPCLQSERLGRVQLTLFNAQTGEGVQYPARLKLGSHPAWQADLVPDARQWPCTLPGGMNRRAGAFCQGGLGWESEREVGDDQKRERKKKKKKKKERRRRVRPRSPDSPVCPRVKRVGRRLVLIPSTRTPLLDRSQAPFPLPASMSCQEIRTALASCILKSDCILKSSPQRSVQECLRDHTDELPEECRHLRTAFFECKRGMVRGFPSTTLLPARADDRVRQLDMRHGEARFSLLGRARRAHPPFVQETLPGAGSRADEERAEAPRDGQSMRVDMERRRHRGCFLVLRSLLLLGESPAQRERDGKCVGVLAGSRVRFGTLAGKRS